MTTVTRQIHFAFKGRRKRAVEGPPPDPATWGGGGRGDGATNGGGPAHPPTPGRVPRVARLMALAIRFDKLLRDGVVGSQSDLAAIAHVTQPRMTQIMNLLHLAPDVQEALLFLPPVVHGHDPITERHLRHICGRQSWSSQRKAWRSFLGRLNTDASTDRTDVGASLRNSNRN